MRRGINMRGSVYYQTGQLVQTIFEEGLSKERRIDPNDDRYNYLTSYSTAKTYRNIWNNFFNYLKEHWKIKNCELITAEQVEAYFEYKIEYHPSAQYVEKICSALGALQFALNTYSKRQYEVPITYDFSIRSKILHKARELNLIAINYVNRTYLAPEIIIENLTTAEHKLAATIQVQGGARVEGVLSIKKEQLKGYKDDPISGRRVGVIETKEKGGKVGDVMIKADTYAQLESYFWLNDRKFFRINYQKYAREIREACMKAGITPKGSHGFRWTFAQNRVREYQLHGYSYEQAIQGVSWEMKHFRPDITEHYLARPTRAKAA